MKKYDVKKVMRRAWEIKNDDDCRTYNRNRSLRINGHKEIEIALFSECLKIAWAEAKRAIALAEKFEISLEKAEKMAAEETRLSIIERVDSDEIKWNMWEGHGKVRAYYNVRSWSNYRNKKGNFVDIA
ncbi:hypothetical protein [Faecalicatena contorta]|uniref:Uncharacterized protein n=1 Tax=Faecalicatena contorta TaxID=39482 RepID=A0A315ZUV5_9FIRM|nr:hypothetical protein [Faecalicatena contorta]PWJ49366.1 hypothetical protein A8805_10763 [Faecalicatena contorta]SUQ14610.1 hypothetical protein SAMN05216529_10763 [Faecalicatena contorta]